MRWLIFSVAVAISLMVAGCGAVAPKVEGGKAGMSVGAVADAGTKPLTHTAKRSETEQYQARSLM